MSRTRWLIAGVVVLVIAVVLAMSGDEKDEPYRPTQRDAIRMCRENVTGKLRAPATATFGGEEATATEGGYDVRGHVDAENGFGANVRTEWTCEAVHLGGGEWATRAALSPRP